VHRIGPPPAAPPAAAATATSTARNGRRARRARGQDGPCHLPRLLRQGAQPPARCSRAARGPGRCHAAHSQSFVRASTLSPCDAEAGPHEARRVTPRPTRSCDAEAGAARQERVWFCQKGVKGRGPGGRAPPCDDTRDYEKGGAGARPALRTAAARSCGRAGCVTAARHAAQGTACGTTSRGCCGRRAPPFPRPLCAAGGPLGGLLRTDTCPQGLCQGGPHPCARIRSAKFLILPQSSLPWSS